jgi:hypothetical protein
MALKNKVMLFDHEAKQRIGEMIGNAVRRGGSTFSYVSRTSCL